LAASPATVHVRHREDVVGQQGQGVVEPEHARQDGIAAARVRVESIVDHCLGGPDHERLIGDRGVRAGRGIRIERGPVAAAGLREAPLLRDERLDIRRLALGDLQHREHRLICGSGGRAPGGGGGVGEGALQRRGGLRHLRGGEGGGIAQEGLQVLLPVHALAGEGRVEVGAHLAVAGEQCAEALEVLPLRPGGVGGHLHVQRAVRRDVSGDGCRRRARGRAAAAPGERDGAADGAGRREGDDGDDMAPHAPRRGGRAHQPGTSIGINDENGRTGWCRTCNVPVKGRFRPRTGGSRLGGGRAAHERPQALLG